MMQPHSGTGTLKAIAITCTYHDTENVVKVLARFPENLVEEICIVVDGATNDELLKIQKATEKIKTTVHIISNQRREGVGNAIRRSIEYAVNKKFDIAVLLAGNNKDDPKEIPRLLNPIIREGYDYIQGSRFLPGGRHVKNPFFRQMFSRLYAFLWTLLTNIRCTDVTNGFRAYRLSLFSDKRINIWQDWLKGYELEYYIHYKVLTLGYRLKEVPISKVYPYRHKGGYSQISPLKDWWKIVKPLVYLTLGIKD